jgi:elongation factor P--beta-lysine ligase
MKITTNINSLANYKKFLKVWRATEQFLDEQGYLKLELPVLLPALIPESYLEIFATEFCYFNRRQKLYLSPSPELLLKRLMVEKIGDCYYLGKAFRNSEPTNELHLPEFNMLEFYKVNCDYNDIKKEISKLLLFISQKVCHTKEITYRGKKINFSKKWEEISVAEAFVRYAHIAKDELFNQLKFKQKAKEKGYQISNASYIDLFSQIYTQEIEPRLGVNGRPTIIYDYPKEMAALAKLNKDNLTAQRFEFYIAGVELGDCYTELTNWQEQAKRFEEEAALRQKTKKINHPVDWGFIEALKKGLPNSAGIAIGFERLAMIFADVVKIKDIRLVNLDD